MQALYAYKQAEKSNFQIALDQLAETFSPDLNSMEVQDPHKLEGKRQLATILFQENYQHPDTPLSDETASPDVFKAVASEIEQYHKQVRKDGQYFARTMLSEVEKIYDRYLLILLLLIDLADMVKEEEENRKTKYLKAYTVFPGNMKLYNNRLIQALRENKQLELEAIKRGLNWNAERELVRKVYTLVLKNEQTYQDYIKKPESSLEEDKQMVNFILRNLVYKQELLKTYFEEADLNWIENGEIIKSMLGKTVKSMETEESPIELLTLSKNWEDDREFFVQLYQHSLNHDAQYEQLIVDKIQNWDAERVAVIDKILLKMAIGEMVSFPSIPVKVTINEYIELSKLYSTPKSRQFVNGVLDVVALELINTGIIRKSGRGLIDNK